MRLWCCRCGKSISSEVPEGTVLRAYAECPECIEQQPDWKARAEAAEAALKELRAELNHPPEGRLSERLRKWREVYAIADEAAAMEERAVAVAAANAVLQKHLKNVIRFVRDAHWNENYEAYEAVKDARGALAATDPRKEAPKP